MTVPGQAPTTYGYDAAGNLESVANPNGTTATYTYNLLNRLTRMATTTANTAVASYQYTLGAAGNRKSVTELSGRTVNYGYDDAYRLTLETISGAVQQNGAIGYVYDAVGNRKTMSSTVAALPPGLWNYDANDRITTDTYDDNGNTIADAGTQNVYDFENHLTQRGGVTIVYDGDGNRVSETVAGVTTNYLVDNENPTGYAQVVEELQGGAVVRSYTWGHWLISANQQINSAWQTSYYGYDGHGSVRFLTDASGAVTDTYDYDAFGNLISSTGNTPNNYLFAAEQFDPALNLYYNRARYLDVRVGRFWGMDTAKGTAFDPASLHRYIYAGADPINQFDHSGLSFAAGEAVGASAEQGIDAGEQQLVLQVFKTVFRTTVYAGEELVYSAPSKLLQVIAMLTGTALATTFLAWTLTGGSPSGDQLPDVQTAQQYENDRNQGCTCLWRDVSGPSPSQFRLRPQDKHMLSFFEVPQRQSKFSVGFKWTYRPPKETGKTLGGFLEQELVGIGTIYTPNAIGEHWDAIVPVGLETAYEDRMAAAAKRIRSEVPSQWLKN